ncbi:MAG TPA: M15 family metallopeptidase [Acidimicrobiales bacterium]|nr:M15 family metallopeptidase [Acidimicrobiales bacterium]
MPARISHPRAATLLLAAALAFGPSPVRHAAQAAASTGTTRAGTDQRAAAGVGVAATLRRLDASLRDRAADLTAARAAHAEAVADLDAATGAGVTEPTSRTGLLPPLGPGAWDPTTVSTTGGDGSPAAVAAQREAEAAAAVDEAAATLEATRAEAAELAAALDERGTAVTVADVVAAGAPAAGALRDQEAQITVSIDQATQVLAAPSAAPPAAPPAPAPAPPGPPPLPDPTGSASGAVSAVTCPAGGWIVVDSSLAGSLQTLLDDARDWGVSLCAKSGFRSYAEQVELRRANCGDSDYGIHQALPSTCSPPTARPGTSNHEGGLAVDFSCDDGQPMTQASPCYQWLAAYAGLYGLYNLPSEPWHWSIDGS